MTNLPSPILGFDHVQLAGPPGCESEARAFWNGVIGLDEVPKPDELLHRGGVWFRCGAQGLHVGTHAEHVPNPKAHPAIRVATVAALQALAERIEAAGYPVDWADVPVAEARCKMHDPFGNLIELLVGSTG